MCLIQIHVKAVSRMTTLFPRMYLVTEMYIYIYASVNTDIVPWISLLQVLEADTGQTVPNCPENCLHIHGLQSLLLRPRFACTIVTSHSLYTQIIYTRYIHIYMYSHQFDVYVFVSFK